MSSTNHLEFKFGCVCVCVCACVCVCVCVCAGSCECRAGWAGEDNPKLIFRNAVAKARGKKVRACRLSGERLAR